MEKQQIGDENDIVMNKIRSIEDFDEEGYVGVLSVLDSTYNLGC